MRIRAKISSFQAALSAMDADADELFINYTAENLADLATNAIARNVLVFADFPYPCLNSELDERANLIADLYLAGFSGFSVADLGTLSLVKTIAPEAILHWTTPCFSQEDIDFAAKIGSASAFLSPFLTKEKILALKPKTALSLLVSGSLCPSDDPVNCFLANSKEYCGLACRKTFGYYGVADDTLLLTRDICILNHFDKLKNISVVVVEPPSNDKDIVSFFVDQTARAFTKKSFDVGGISRAAGALGRPPPTDALFANKGEVFAQKFSPSNIRKDMFYPLENPVVSKSISVRFLAVIQKGHPVRLWADDYCGNRIYVDGAVPSFDRKGVSPDVVNKLLLSPTKGFQIQSAQTKVGENLYIPPVVVSALREELLRQIKAKRKQINPRKPGTFQQKSPMVTFEVYPAITVKVETTSQISPELLSLRPERLYLPLDVAANNLELSEEIIESGVIPVVVFPKVCDNYKPLSQQLEKLFSLGFREALCETVPQIEFSISQKFAPRADLFATNNLTLELLEYMKVASCTISPRLTFSEINKLRRPIPIELIGYGRLPLIHTPICLIKLKNNICACENLNEITDEQGEIMPILHTPTHSSTLYAHKKLFILPEKKLWSSIGLWALRLDFTTENTRDCVNITKAFMKKGTYVPPNSTTGLYIE